jgi:hypothetical protein
MTYTALQQYDPKIDLVKWQGLSIEAERIATAIQITDDEEEGMAVDSLSRIKQFQKETESARKDHVEPFNILVKRVNTMFRPIAESLEKAESAIKEKIKFYRVEKEKVRREAEAKALAEYQAKVDAERKAAEAKHEIPKIVAPPPVILPASQTTRSSEGAATVRAFWNYEVLDIHELYKAKPGLVALMEKRREILEAIKTNQNIPGLRIFEDTLVSAR